VSNSVVSSVLVHEERKKQHPVVYFISRTLQPTEECYQVIEKLVLGLIFSTRRLHHYFRSFEIIVYTDYLIRQVLQKSDLTKMMTTWAIELFEFSLKYKSRGLMKAQFLVDFLIELLSMAKNDWWSLSIN